MLRAVAEPEAVERLASQIKESPMGEVRVPVRVANPDAPRTLLGGGIPRRQRREYVSGAG